MLIHLYFVGNNTLCTKRCTVERHFTAHTQRPLVFLVGRTFPTHLHSKADSIDTAIRLPSVPLWFLYSLESSRAPVPPTASSWQLCLEVGVMLWQKALTVGLTIT